MFLHVCLYRVGAQLSDHLPLPLGDDAVRVGKIALLAGVADPPDLDGFEPRILRLHGRPHVIHHAIRRDAEKLSDPTAIPSVRRPERYPCCLRSHRSTSLSGVRSTINPILADMLNR